MVLRGDRVWGGGVGFEGFLGVGFEGFLGVTWFSGGTEGGQSSLTTGKRVTIES